jgi:mycothiol S-conjugate amidase
VIVAPNQFGGDGHPDHIRASLIATAAFEAAGDPSQFPEQLEGTALVAWSPSKLYEAVAQTPRREKIMRALREGGVRGLVGSVLRVARHWSPKLERRRAAMAAAQQPVTTRVAVGGFLEAKYAALREYRSQIPSNESFFALTPAQRRQVSPTEDFTLRVSRVATSAPEDDLFSGIR